MNGGHCLCDHWKDFFVKIFDDDDSSFGRFACSGGDNARGKVKTPIIIWYLVRTEKGKK